MYPAAAASRKITVQLGVGVSAAKPDYDNSFIKGGSIYGSINFGSHFAIEGDYHNLLLFTPQDIGESSYLLGVSYGLTRHSFHPYVKAQAGLGTFQFQQGTYPATTSSTHKIYALGGGLDYYLRHNINIRIIDLEHQSWPGFGDHGLTPVVGTVGAAYRFW